MVAFEFLVLNASRSGEVRGARWAEVDRAAAVWTVSAARMKAGWEHRVPLSDQALAVLEEARQLADGAGLVFPTATGRTPSQSEMPKLPRQIGLAAVPHGFRFSFRDWAAERTEAPREVCELALGAASPLCWRRGPLALGEPLCALAGPAPHGLVSYGVRRAAAISPPNAR